MSESEFPEPKLVEALLAECIRRYELEGDAGVDEFLGKHGEHADRIRERLSSLRDFGFFKEFSNRPHAIGPYRIERELGRGGLGTVYLATDSRLGRQVALKVLRSETATGRDRERFQREMRAVARLAHASIVPVHNVAEQEGSAYFTMEYVEGDSLAAALGKLRSNRNAEGFPTAEKVRAVFPGWNEKDYLCVVCKLMIQISSALEHVHQAGILHRDVKPSNILLNHDGRAQLIDFGLASLLDDPALTTTGDFLGTPQYVSPEQARGDWQLVDRRTDVYSLGVVLYELLTLAVPFRGPSTHQLFREIELGTPKPPRVLNSAVPKDLETICLTAMSSDLERRYRSTGELSEDLQCFLAVKPILARPSSLAYKLLRYAERNRLLLGSVIVVVVALCIALWVTEQARIDAQVAGSLASKQLSDIERLSDKLLVGELLEQSEQLYPSTGSDRERLDEWIAEAEAVIGRRELHLASLKEWRAKIGMDEAASSNEELGRLAGEPLKERWRVLTSVELLRELDRLEGVAVSVHERRERAEEIARVSLEEAEQFWISATRDIAKSPIYQGLELAPQLGLVPLGIDPESGLWEFWHVETGDRPTRSLETGRVVSSDDAGLVFVLLPTSSFSMGATLPTPGDKESAKNTDPHAQGREAPVHEVELRAFFLSKFEMTQGQWLRVTGENPSYFSPEFDLSTGAIALTHPVESLSWQEFELWLPRLGLSIPTEAQWEYGARAGTTTPWSTGADRSLLRGYANLADQTARATDAPKTWKFEEWRDGASIHARVGSYEPNSFGLFDTYGNTWEWCRDRFASYSNPVGDGDGARLGGFQGVDRIMRGGSYTHSAEECRSAARSSMNPEGKLASVGVRPARAIH